MAFLGILGLLLIGTGPLLVLFALVVARKSFLILLCLAGSFYWLTILLAISTVLRVFIPTNGGFLSSLFLVLVAVALEETARQPQNYAYRVGCGQLRRMAQAQGGSWTLEDDLTLALTLGVSQAFTHSLVFFAGWLPFLWPGGTLYAPSCWKVSFFLQAALNSLGFSLILPAAAMLSCCAVLQRRGPRASVAVPAVLHAAAGIMTVLGIASSPVCSLGIPGLLLLGLAASGVAAAGACRCVGVPEGA